MGRQQNPISTQAIFPQGYEQCYSIVMSCYSTTLPQKSVQVSQMCSEASLWLLERKLNQCTDVFWLSSARPAHGAGRFAQERVEGRRYGDGFGEEKAV